LGGPRRDGIPAIDRPAFVTVDEATFLASNDRVLGLELEGMAKAYPIKILNWHEVVNDRFGERPVAITYCPLCGSGVAFAAGAPGRVRQFGVSGLLFNSDVLLYDRETESLWSQLLMQAVSGPDKGERLAPLPLVHTSWQAWRDKHPETLVLSTKTGFDRDYSVNPYPGYATDDAVRFPVRERSARYHPKERVLGVEVNGTFKAYPLLELSRQGMSTFNDVIDGQLIVIQFDAQSESARALDHRGELLPAITAFWFAWYAFHPDTEVFQATR
jgi:hypothetical protein